jgi:hypothetical protein
VFLLEVSAWKGTSRMLAVCIFRTSTSETLNESVDLALQERHPLRNRAEPATRSDFDAVVDRVKIPTFMGTDRPHVLRQAIRNFPCQGERLYQDGHEAALKWQ